MWWKNLSGPSLAAPAPQRVLRHRQRLAPCWLHSSQGACLERGKKSSASSHGDQAGEMDWGRRGELPWESSAKPPALHRNKPAPLPPYCLTAPKPVPCVVPLMSPPRASSQRTSVHCGPRYTSGRQELPLRKAACTGLGHRRDSGGVQHTLRETEGVSPAKGLPSLAAGMVGKKKRASGWCKGLDGSWLR